MTRGTQGIIIGTQNRNIRNNWKSVKDLDDDKDSKGAMTRETLKSSRVMIGKIAEASQDDHYKE